MSARHIDTLVRAQHTVVLYLCNDGRTIDANHQHVQCAIIKQYMVTFLDICRKILIRQIDNVMSGVDVRTSEELHHIARLVPDRCITSRSTNLRTFGIYQDADVTAHFAHVPYYILNTILRGMCRVHPDHIDASIIQLTDKIHITATVTDRGNNLCLFHNLIPINLVQRYEKYRT